MGKPITTTQGGVCTAFPNVCKTQVGTATSPIPYPSIGQLSDAEDTADTVLAGGDAVVTKDSSISSSLGDAAGTLGGVKSQDTGGKVEFKSASESVFAEGAGVIRMFDQTDQNVKDDVGNAVGVVLGGVPTILVGD